MMTCKCLRYNIFLFGLTVLIRTSVRMICNYVTMSLNVVYAVGLDKYSYLNCNVYGVPRCYEPVILEGNGGGGRGGAGLTGETFLTCKKD